MAGNITREMIGERALKLKSERQAKAVTLTDAAAALEQNRNALLQSLFPALKNVQLANISAAKTGFDVSNAAMPEAGLSGQSIANIWLARVGATNQLAQQEANVGAANTAAQGQIWSNALGGATAYGARALPSTSSVWNSIANSSSGSTPAVYDWTKPQSYGGIA
jgi:hypothetical protein